MRPTRYPELCYQNVPGVGWRFVDASDGACIGPIYPTRAELLADLQRYAELFGCATGKDGVR